MGLDEGNIMGMLNAMKSHQVRYPWAAKTDVNTLNPQFDTTNYYPIQAAQRSRMDSMNQISNPSIARAVGSYQPDQINGILQETQRVHGNNLQIANSAQAENANIMNNYNAQEAQRQTGLYDNTVKTLDNRDTTNDLRSKNFLDQFNNARNNKAQMAYILAQNPQYGITNPNDYSSLVRFNGKGKGWNDPSTQQPSEADEMLANYTKFKNSGLGLNHDQIVDMLTRINRGKYDYTQTEKKPGQQGQTTINKSYYPANQ